MSGVISNKFNKNDNLNIYPFGFGITYGFAWFFMYYHNNWCGCQCKRGKQTTNKIQFTNMEYTEIHTLKLQKKWILDSYKKQN